MVEQINHITNKAQFLQFVRDLAKDNLKNPEEWENTTISAYLEQMAGWVEDYSESPMNDIEWNKIDFRTLAIILYMGKIYE